MSNLEDENRDLREKNSELAKEVQNLKILAAQKEKEKLELTKENNELRLKISRLRSFGAAQARKLDAGLQAVSQEALTHIVQASGAVTRTIELAKQYMQERQELELDSPRWSPLNSVSNGVKKVNEVPPLLLGGQSIQPVVSLSRTLLSNNSNRSINRSPTQNSAVTHRNLSLRMLQDVFIPLTRIDAAIQSNRIEAEENVEEDNSTADLGLEESIEQSVDAEDSQNLSTVSEFDETRGLDAVMEESAELETEVQTPPSESRPNVVADNPLEGPSWLLDIAGVRENLTRAQTRPTLEPDSTTPCDTPHTARDSPTTNTLEDEAEKENAPSLAFTPTVRRRKRATTPPRTSFSPRPHPPRKHNTARILKVVVAKMRLSDPDASGDCSPPKRTLSRSPPLTPRHKDRSDDTRRSVIDGRPSSRRSTIDGRAGDSSSKDDMPRFDAPSPNGTTDAGVIVCESNQPPQDPQPRASRRDTRSHSRTSSRDQSRDQSRDHSRDHSRSDSRIERSDSRMEYSDGEINDETRSRRVRKQVSYKEKPLNRKLRR